MELSRKFDGGIVDALEDPSNARPAGGTGEKKPWHMPEVRVSSVPGITANDTSPKVGDGFADCASS